MDTAFAALWATTRGAAPGPPPRSLMRSARSFQHMHKKCANHVQPPFDTPG